jgi:hypothetical protein
MPDLNFKNFILEEQFFENHSERHGINHTYRVMFHVLNIGINAKLFDEIKLAWCAAFIHDMARKHDGYCTEHGQWSAETKLPIFQKLFINEGVDKVGIEAIRLAVSNHSLREEVPADNPYYKTVALLKDADALDRIRISESNLKVEYLRFPETVELVGFAKKLYYATADEKLNSFADLLKIVARMESESKDK